MKGVRLFLAVGPLAMSAPLAAQSMDHSMPDMNMPGMEMPVKKPAAKPKPKAPATPSRRPSRPAKPKAAAREATERAHEGQGASAAKGMQDMPMPQAEKPAADDAGQDPQAGHDMSAMPGMAMPMAPQHGAAGTALPPGNAPAPAPPADHYADRVYSPPEMARARDEFRREHGGSALRHILFNLAEYRARKGSNGYRWDGEAWIGGDINRVTLKSEGEGAFRGGVESAEIQALYSRALDPYWNLQAGVRYDFKPDPSRTYATIGIEGLAPYWFEVEGALFLSDKGDVLARAEGYYDQRITQRLILQPRVELNFAAQDVPENRIGSGLSNAEFGLRLRYEVAREFAPYIGISYDRKVGDTARYARLDGESVGATSFVIGARTWF